MCPARSWEEGVAGDRKKHLLALACPWLWFTSVGNDQIWGLCFLTPALDLGGEGGVNHFYIPKADGGPGRIEGT